MAISPIPFILALLATLFCFAVNAYTYRIAYPLWRLIPAPDFSRVHIEYLRRLTPVITLPHVLMFFSTGWLALRPTFWLPRAPAVAVFSLATIVILLSAFIAGPIHGRFQRNCALDVVGLDRLIHLSAWRTLLMAAASAILLWSPGNGMHVCSGMRNLCWYLHISCW